MRFMMMASNAEAANRTEYNKTLQKAGVLLAVDELFPPSTAAHITYMDGKATVTDAPSAESNESISGFWIIQVRSREEAIEWARRAPLKNHQRIEIRQLHDFPEDA